MTEWVSIRLVDNPLSLLNERRCEGNLLSGLSTRVEPGWWVVACCQVHAGVCERRLYDRMRNVPGVKCVVWARLQWQIPNVMKIVLGKDEGHGSAICHGDGQRIICQCTASANGNLRNINEDRRDNKCKTNADAVWVACRWWQSGSRGWAWRRWRTATILGVNKSREEHSG